MSKLQGGKYGASSADFGGAGFRNLLEFHHNVRFKVVYRFARKSLIQFSVPACVRCLCACTVSRADRQQGFWHFVRTYSIACEL